VTQEQKEQQVLELRALQQQVLEGELEQQVQQVVQQVVQQEQELQVLVQNLKHQ
jgi:hypothetical protein